jgi:hypothetical protein
MAENNAAEGAAENLSFEDPSSGKLIQLVYANIALKMKAGGN